MIAGGVVILVGTCLVSLVIAWRKGWPRWSGSWLVFWVMSSYGPVIILLNNLSPQWDDMVQALSLMILPFVIAWLLYRLACRNPMAALLGVLPIIAGSQISIQEFVPRMTENLLNIALFMMIGLVSGVMIRTGSWRLGFWLSAGLILVANTLANYAAHYLIVLPAEAGLYSPTPLTDIYRDIVISTVGAFTILVGPFLGRTLAPNGE